MSVSASPGLPDHDIEHLRQLTLFHYIYCGLHVAFFFFGLSFFGFALAIALHPELAPGAETPDVLRSVTVTAAGMVLVFVSATMALCNYLVGRFLKRRKNAAFCIVIAIVNCLNLPLGTALGVFTIIVLRRPNVKAMFASR